MKRGAAERLPGSDASEISSPDPALNDLPRAARRASASARNNRGQILGTKGVRTRQGILDATHEMICERPFRDISAVDIAKRAGVSVPTLYTYFDDVTAIVVALAAFVSTKAPDVRGFADAAWEGSTALEPIAGLVSSLVEFNLDHFPLIRLRNHLADEGDSRLAEIRSNTAKPVIDLLTQKILSRGRMPPVAASIEEEIEARRTAGLLLGMIDRITLLIIQPPYRDRTSTQQQYIQAASRIIHAAVHALPSDGPASPFSARTAAPAP